VSATDRSGNASSKVVHYTVLSPPPSGDYSVKGEGKVGSGLKFEIDAKTGPKRHSGDVEIDVKGHSFEGSVTAISINGSTAILTGSGLDNGKRVNFALIVTDGGNKGKDTLSVTLGTYSAAGNVTDGQIRIRATGNNGNNND
jgi:hypothetical protein